MDSFCSLPYLFLSPPCQVRVVFRVGDVSVVCSVGNTDYQTLHEKELRRIEEETHRRIKCFLEGTCPLHLRKELYLSLAVNVC